MHTEELLGCPAVGKTITSVDHILKTSTLCKLSAEMSQVKSLKLDSCIFCTSQVLATSSVIEY